MNFVWYKPVLSFYRERIPREKEPFAVAKALKLEVTKSEKEGIYGRIHSFFPLMGNLDYLFLHISNALIDIRASQSNTKLFF